MQRPFLCFELKVPASQVSSTSLFLLKHSGETHQGTWTCSFMICVPLKVFVLFCRMYKECENGVTSSSKLCSKIWSPQPSWRRNVCCHFCQWTWWSISSEFHVFFSCFIEHHLVKWLSSRTHIEAPPQDRHIPGNDATSQHGPGGLLAVAQWEKARDPFGLGWFGKGTDLHLLSLLWTTSVLSSAVCLLPSRQNFSCCEWKEGSLHIAKVPRFPQSAGPVQHSPLSHMHKK